jgi:esterase FrsA
MATTTVVGRPKTLDESKEYLRRRLAGRLNPMLVQDQQAAAEGIERLESLDADHWASVWAEYGARFEEQAKAAEARGDKAAADAAYFQAYAFYFLGRFPCPNTPAKRENAVKARALYLRAAEAFDPPLTRVAIPFAGRPAEGSEVVIHVRKPRGVDRPPALVNWGGVDSFKEERNHVAEPFLEAGFAVVSMDMPGTGESPVLGSLDAERQYTPVFEWLRAQPDLDGQRIVCVGGSFGGYWANKIAHTHREYLRGVCGWGGGAHLVFQPEWTAKSRYADSYLSDLTHSRGNSMGIDNYDDYVAFVPRLSLLEQGLVDGPCAPLLLVNGKNDTQTPIEDFYFLMEHGDPKACRVFPGGHMGNTPDTVPTIIRWLRARVDGR